MVNQLYIHNLNVNNSLCLRNSTKLLAESLIWTSKTPWFDYRRGPFWISVHRGLGLPWFSLSKCLFLYISQQSLWVKLNFWLVCVSDIFDLIWLSTWTILKRSKCPGSVKDLFFKAFKQEKLPPRWFFVRETKWRPKTPVKNNFSSLLLQRPKIVKVSLVDGLLGCS